MDPDSRREMIVRSALPLVIEHGSAVTTRQIARAAGIGEGTIFRVFADKEELLDACVTEALSPAPALDELALVSMEQPLATRLTEAASALHAHLDRVGAVVGALHATGGRGRSGRPGSSEAPPDRAAGSLPVREALAELFEPERESLRLPPEQAALIFLGLLFVGNGRQPVEGESADPSTQSGVHDLVDVFLHGVLSQPVEN
ncbi:TetR/AcrR family transcriptional regulator [Streptomyces pseudovenezuelae]|uniref:AcrR family transcriptional regulator n=1 Tax=Streptomyces pseudovenezuelae TaxID=67350 RepID=A0ABT6M0D2_9ACTN|nr:TetR/AcrR family transcriptional regulator [Streptomyces pseudovenezuelae]MDH6222024.1 AcrR family transcriptional regulator [Streptomyces pseudovenezuelae]